MDKLLHIDQISGTNANYYLFKAEILAIQGKNDEALKELKKFIPALKTAFALKNQERPSIQSNCVEGLLVSTNISQNEWLI